LPRLQRGGGEELEEKKRRRWGEGKDRREKRTDKRGMHIQ
jgi:hypothetical protein